MKVCLFLQRHFAGLGNAIAVELKKLGVEEFCAYSYPLWAVNFLRQQSNIKYTSLLVDEDVIKDYKNVIVDYEYLKKIEEEYGDPNLARFIFLDRFIMTEYPQKSYSLRRLVSHEDALRILQLRFKAIINFLEQEKPDVVIFSAIALMSSAILYQVAKKKGIKILQLSTTRIENNIGLMTEHEKYGYILKAYDRNMSGDADDQYIKQAQDYLSNFIDKPQPYLNLQSYKSPGIAKRFYKAGKYFLKTIQNFYFTDARTDYATQTPWNYFKERFVRKLRHWRGMTDLFQNPNHGDKYIFSPLHLEPEAATLVLAPFYEDQINLIKNIALSLPSNTVLYVKDHPGMLNLRPRRYYKRILNIPNVRLINTKFSSFELIKNASAVITITGTAGWEAVLLKKPVITFGNCFYNIFSSVKKCDNFENLPQLIKQQIECFEYSEKEIICYLAAIFEESVSLDLYNIWHFKSFEEIVKDGSVKELAEYINKKI